MNKGITIEGISRGVAIAKSKAFLAALDAKDAFYNKPLMKKKDSGVNELVVQVALVVVAIALCAVFNTQITKFVEDFVKTWTTKLNGFIDSTPSGT